MKFNPDLVIAKQFLEIIAPDGDITFQTFDDKKRKLPHLTKIIHGLTDGNLERLVRLNNEGAGIFFMVNRGDLKGRSSANVKQIRAVFVDLDENGPGGLQKVMSLDKYRPRVVIESSPNKYHVYWQIDGELPLECFTPVQQHFINKYDADPNPKDLPRVLRLPGFYHQKEEPFQTRIHDINLESCPLPASKLIALSQPDAIKKTELLGGAMQGTKQDYSDFLPISNTPVDLDRLRSALEFIPAVVFEIWRDVGFALKNDLADEGLEIWREWSATYDEFKPGEIDPMWRSFKSGHPNPVTLGSIFHLAKEHGWQPAMGGSFAEWSEPMPLPDNLSPVLPFDFDLLPTTLKPWVTDISELMQCPPDYVAVAVMTTLGSVIGRKVAIRPQERTDWTVIANQWGLIIGRPGVMKSPALEQGLAPTKRLAAMANDIYLQELAEYQLHEQVAELRANAAKKQAAEVLKKNPQADVLSVLSLDKPPQPTLKRYITTDSTPEALAELLRQNLNGLLVHRDELVSLLISLDREDNANGRGFYLTGWNGDGSYTFDRIGRGMNMHIPAVCISLLGCTQPGRLAAYVQNAVRGGAGDDGLFQRFGLMVWPDTDSQWSNIDREPDQTAKLEAYNVFDYLDKFDALTLGAKQDTDYVNKPCGVPYLRFAPDAQAIFNQWRARLEKRLRSSDMHPALESHFAKYRKLIPGLALIIHIAEKNKGPVSAGAIKKAIAWDTYLESHAYRIYQSATMRDRDSAAELLKHIQKRDLPDTFTARDVYRKNWSRLSKDLVPGAVQFLIDYEWLAEIRETNTGGRHATKYMVNPKGNKGHPHG